MSPVARLGAGVVVAAAGGALVTAGGRAAWYTMQIRGQEFDVPGKGAVTVGERTVGLRGSDLAGEVVALGAVVVVLALLALLVGPRVRVAALAGALAAAAVAGAVSVLRGAGRASDLAILLGGGPASAYPRARAAGLWVTAAGAALAALGAMTALMTAGSVPRLGLPESSAPEPGTPP